MLRRTAWQHAVRWRPGGVITSKLLLHRSGTWLHRGSASGVSCMYIATAVDYNTQRRLNRRARHNSCKTQGKQAPLKLAGRPQLFASCSWGPDANISWGILICVKCWLDSMLGDAPCPGGINRKNMHVLCLVCSLDTWNASPMRNLLSLFAFHARYQQGKCTAG